MDKLKVALVGAGSIAQVVHLPILQSIEEVEITAICDVNESKITPLLDKFNITNWYDQVDTLVREEDLDALHICTTNHYHFPMAYLALKNNIHVFVEKPIALNGQDALKIDQLAKQNHLQVVVGMQNRFRDDVRVLKEFIEKGELGDIYYIKSGWLKRWTRKPVSDWQTRKKESGGGVLLDLGSQLIDLALFLTGMPKIKSVRLYDYIINPELEVEDSALAVIQTEQGASITIEVSWRMHMENEMQYTNIFGSRGAAYLDPLSINAEMHGNLVNVTPFTSVNSAERFTESYRNEINHFYQVIQGQATNQSSSADAVRLMRIIDALYESALTKQQIELLDQ